MPRVVYRWYYRGVLQRLVDTPDSYVLEKSIKNALDEDTWITTAKLENRPTLAGVLLAGLLDALGEDE